MYKNKNTITLLLFGVITSILTSSLAVLIPAAITFLPIFNTNRFWQLVINFGWTMLAVFVIAGIIYLLILISNRRYISRAIAISDIASVTVPTEIAIKPSGFFQRFSRSTKNVVSNVKQLEALDKLNKRLAIAKSRILSKKSMLKIIVFYYGIAATVLAAIIPLGFFSFSEAQTKP